MPDPATDGRRYAIFELFSHFGITDPEQMRAEAARILVLDYLPDLRELSNGDADDLVYELRRALGLPAREHPCTWCCLPQPESGLRRLIDGAWECADPVACLARRRNLVAALQRGLDNAWAALERMQK